MDTKTIMEEFEYLEEIDSLRERAAEDKAEIERLKKNELACLKTLGVEDAAMGVKDNSERLRFEIWSLADGHKNLKKACGRLLGELDQMEAENRRMKLKIESLEKAKWAGIR